MQQNARIFWLVIKVYFFDQYETWKYWIEVEHMSQSGKKDTKSTLLDFLAERAGCAYLSDLRKPYLFPGLSEIMDSIEPRAYSFSEWADAISYITGEHKEVSDEQEAKSFLVHCLKK